MIIYKKTTPEDADTLMIKDTISAVNKRTPFSGVWTWIKSKMQNEFPGAGAHNSIYRGKSLGSSVTETQYFLHSWRSSVFLREIGSSKHCGKLKQRNLN